MMELRSDTGETYRIRTVPLDEARALRAAGAIFYDYTKLTAANTCPTWGVIRYGLHKTEIPLDQGGRNLAIEAGSACHDFFAAIRLWTLIKASSSVIDKKVFDYGVRLFGRERFDSMMAVPQDSDPVNNAQMFALDALHTTGYYDDPKDRRRTMSNMEESCLVYADRYFKSKLPVVVRGDLIGIEIPFVLEVTRYYMNHGFNTLGERSYYCGRIDGIHEWGDQLAVGENKTSARLTDAWRMSFAISHQITGYMIAAGVLLDTEINNAIVMGVQLPLPKSAFDGVSFELVTRTESDRLRWCEWFFHSIATYETYIAKATQAPRYPHSCNRYFSACQFIPFCALPREDQANSLADMRVEEWSPLDHIDEKAEAE